MLKTIAITAVSVIVGLAVWELFVKSLVVKSAYEANFEG